MKGRAHAVRKRHIRNISSVIKEMARAVWFGTKRSNVSVMDQDAIAIMIWQATILGINVFQETVGTSILAEPEATGSGPLSSVWIVPGEPSKTDSPKTRRVFTSGDQGLHRTPITSKPAQLARLARGHERKNPRTFASNRLFLCTVDFSLALARPFPGSLVTT